jgi:four helix bundle protein
MKENALLKKTYELALESVVVYKVLVVGKEYILSKQLLRCSTSPGAMAEEAQGAHSRRDFIVKLEIALKEVKESKYWFRLLVESKYLDAEEYHKFQGLQNECEALLTSIIVSSKAVK